MELQGLNTFIFIVWGMGESIDSNKDTTYHRRHAWTHYRTKQTFFIICENYLGTFKSDKQKRLAVGHCDKK